MPTICPNCGQENPDGFRLCGMCGAALVPEKAAVREERKVVTVLFCDLVGSTARAESLDPEDVRAVLARFHGAVRAELERHGGTVEKFIGDAVMALFGAPVAHEDDPERAVRAALAIRDAASADGTDVRIGVTTGEALVALGANPAEGEGMASGDVVNTAARLQAHAPVNGILVGEATQRATRHVIDYAAHDPVRAKGKAEPIATWVATGARSRFGTDVTHRARTGLVGRERELGLLAGALDRAHQDRQPQLVTLVGVPGIGKSRLIFELSQIVDARPGLVTWRQGRCLAYGEGVAYWALGEIVKAQAGIVERDDPDITAAKLEEAVRTVIEGEADRRWVVGHLRPLVGLSAADGLHGDKRGEAFAAWRRYLEALAEQRPTVLVIEDLHWADDGLLDFVDELVDWLTDVPMFVVCTARPELLQRRPAWGGGKSNASAITLSALSSDDTTALLSAILETADLPDEVARTLVERAEGNPLYAEQFAQLYVERGPAIEGAMPETLQGLVAARIDGLDQLEKAVLQDASVMGKVFWTGAVATAVRPDPLLHGLARKGFLTRQRHSSVEEETEWSFAHILLRDVAYGQIPRAQRSAKHRRAAEWIAGLGRPEDHAELLAHHWQTALSLAESAGIATDGLVEPTRLALRAAGDRARAVNAFARAAAHYRAALDLWPSDDPDLPRLQFSVAYAAQASGLADADDLLVAAGEAALAAGRVADAAEAEALLAALVWHRGDNDRAGAHLERARELIENAPPSPAKARVLSESSRFLALAGESEVALRVGREALELATELGFDDVRAHALNNMAIAKRALGDPTWRDDLLESVAVARAANSIELGRGLHNLAVNTFDDGDFGGAAELFAESIRVNDQFGHINARFSRGSYVQLLTYQGQWADALREADAFIAACEDSPHYAEPLVRATRSMIRLARGDVAGAEADGAAALERGRRVRDSQMVLPVLAHGIALNRALGRTATADELRSEFDLVIADGRGHVWNTHAAAWTALEAGVAQDLARLIVHEQTPRGAVARALVDDDLETAADTFAAMGSRSDEAFTRVLLAEAGGPRAAEHRDRALAFYREVGATRYVERLERLR